MSQHLVNRKLVCVMQLTMLKLFTYFRSFAFVVVGCLLSKFRTNGRNLRGLKLKRVSHLFTLYASFDNSKDTKKTNYMCLIEYVYKPWGFRINSFVFSYFVISSLPTQKFNLLKMISYRIQLKPQYIRFNAQMIL